MPSAFLNAIKNVFREVNPERIPIASRVIFVGLAIQDQFFSMFNPPEILVVIEGLLPALPEIIGKVMQRDMGKGRKLYQVEITLKERFQLHTCRNRFFPPMERR